MRGLEELYADDPERADALLGLDLNGGGRRRVLRVIGAAPLAWFLSETMPFSALRPKGLIPVALAQSEKRFAIEGKEGLIVLSDRPINAETPISLLDDEVTPNDRHYIRNNGLVPERAAKRDLTGWKLTVDETHHGVGVGTLLLKHLARIARSHGLEEFRAYVLAENRAMLEVFENAGFPLERRLEGNVIVATLGLDV